MTKMTFIICTLIIILGSCYIFYAENSHREYIRNMKEPVALETNGIGCTKYNFKYDVWWECPAEKNISSIVEQHNKHSVEIPVVSK